MKIIISGAGEVGKFLAKMLIKENHNIVVIDPNEELLNSIDANNDLMTVVGSCTSFNTLKEVKVNSCDLYIAVTNNEDTNILSCILAKKMGAKKSIARVSNMEYLNATNRLTFINLGIDKLINPEYIASKEIVGVFKQTANSETFEFSDGKLILFAVKIEEKTPIKNMTLKEIAIKVHNTDYKIVAIRRNEKTIIPNDNDTLLKGDIIYTITKPKGNNIFFEFMGIEKFDVNNVMILGASRIGVKSAKFLEKQLNVKLIENNVEKATKLVDELNDTIIINGDGRNVDILLEEGLENMDAFIAVTGDSETNILACILAKNYGIKKTIAEIENIDYIDIASKMGIDKIINKKLSTASNIYTITTTKAEVSSIKWLTGTDAEVLEFVTSKNALITKTRLKDIELPEGVIIGGFVRKDKGYIVNSETQIKQGDKVVLFALAHAIHKIETYF